MQLNDPIPGFNPNAGAPIPLSEAEQWTANYRKDPLTEAEKAAANALMPIISATSCWTRFRPAWMRRTAVLHGSQQIKGGR